MGAETLIQIERKSSYLRVRVPWRLLRQRPLAIASAVFALLLAYLASTAGQFQGIYRGLLALTAVGSAYFSLTHFLNWTDFIMASDHVKIVHGPLPYRLPLQLERSVIARVVANRVGRRLEARTRHGEHIVLIEALSPDVLDVLEAAIKDEPAVAEEAPDPSS